jgi:23S rRNA (pseudouridine1915-N3)-methyltransferase
MRQVSGNHDQMTPITFITVGKPTAKWAQAALDHYQRFLRKYARSEFLWVRAASKQAGTPWKIKALEAERLLKTASSHDGFKIACDASGRTFDSEQFAKHWRKQLDVHSGRAIILIGGPYGLDKSVLAWADLIWSLGPLTLPHDLALVTAVEQIARAFSILRGESYHKQHTLRLPS